MKRLLVSFLSGFLFVGHIFASEPGEIVLEGYSATDSVGIKATRTRGDFASQEKVQSGDELFRIDAYGHNGTSVVGPKGSINIEAAQDWTTTANGTKVTFDITPNGSTTASEVMSIDQDGTLTTSGPTVLSTTTVLNSTFTVKADAAEIVRFEDTGNDAYISVKPFGGSGIKFYSADTLGLDVASGQSIQFQINNTTLWTLYPQGPQPYVRTSAQLSALAPGAAGILVGCSDCTTALVCISSGTGTGAWVLTSNKSTACDD